MYHKATFINICYDFGIYLSFHYSKTLSLIKVIAILQISYLAGFYPGSPKACLNKRTGSAVLQ